MAIFHLRKRIVIIFSVSLLIIYYLITTYHLITRLYYTLYPKESIHCYRQNQPTLPDINDDDQSGIKGGNAIFFHETSCNSYFNNNTIFLYPRQACAVESAARLNPNRNVYLLFASPGIYTSTTNTDSDRVVQALLTYGNVKIRHISYARYTKTTPVEELYRNGAIESSGWAQSHSSDVLRYLTLWKYGGIYLDLDVIVVKSLDGLPKNFAGAESATSVAAGVLGFDGRNNGHKFAEMCLNDLKDNFKGSEWGANGPGVITRLSRKLCRVKEAKDMIHRNCGSFKVFPPVSFYPIRWQDWGKYFDQKSLDNVKELSKNSYTVHVWNKHSVHSKIPINDDVPYTYFARKYCPKVFQQLHEYF